MSSILEDRKNIRVIFPVFVLFFAVAVIFWKFILLGLIPLNADWLYQWSPWKHYIKGSMFIHNPEIGDSLVLQYPFKIYALESIKGGFLPLWNPYIFCGTPFMANTINGIFNPLNILFFIFSTPLAYGLMLMLTLFLAGIFMYIFLREIELSRYAAVFGSFIFILNGYISMNFGIEGCLSSYAYAPALFYLIRKAAIAKELKYAVFSGIVIALMIFSGYLQTTVYFVAAAVLYYSYHAIPYFKSRKSNREAIAVVYYLAVILIIGFALACIQILPTIELIPLSHRFMGAPRYIFNSFPLRNIVTFLVPGFFGHPVDYNYAFFGGGFYDLCVYIGIFPLFMLITAVFLCKRREERFFIIFGGMIFFLLIALNFSVIHKFILNMFPYFDRNNHVRLLSISVFFMSILSASGFDYILKSGSVNRKARNLNNVFFLISILYIAALFIINIVMRFNGQVLVNFINKHLNIATDLSQLRSLYSAFNPNMYLPAVFMLVSVSILNIFSKPLNNPRFVSLLKCFALYFVFIDLFIISSKYNTFIDRKLIYPETEATRFLQADKDVFRIAGLGRAEEVCKPLPPNTNMVYGIQSVAGYDILSIGRYKELIYGIVNNDQINPRSRIGNTVYIHNYDPKILGMLNAKYILADKQIKSDKLNLVYNKDMFIYKNKECLPRAFIVADYKIITDSEMIIKELKAPSFSPSEYAVLEEGIAVQGAHEIATANSYANITEYKPNEVKIDSFLDGNGLLVLSDSFYPGWKAYVDNKETKIYRADYALRAVYLEKGRHSVRFIYRPQSFLIGRNITLITFLSIVAYFILTLQFLKRRRSNYV